MAASPGDAAREPQTIALAIEHSPCRCAVVVDSPSLGWSPPPPPPAVRRPRNSTAANYPLGRFVVRWENTPPSTIDATVLDIIDKLHFHYGWQAKAREGGAVAIEFTQWRAAPCEHNGFRPPPLYGPVP
jgi:hypothetical protein